MSPKNKIEYKSGQKIGECIYLYDVESTSDWRRKALFMCNCGAEFISVVTKVKSGYTKSCGCHRINTIVALNKKHGRSKTPEFNSWVCMRQRCNNPRHKRYADWGGRGISICPKWDTFEQFFKDMGEKPSPSHTLERKDNNKGYCKENCIWGTKSEQDNNRRSNVIIEFKGEQKTLMQWTKELNLPYKLTNNRIRQLGWPIERAFRNPKPRSEWQKV